MLLKTKLLLSLGTLGIAGGTGAGVYLLKNKKEAKPETLPTSEKPVEQTQQPGSTPNPGQTLENTQNSNPS